MGALDLDSYESESFESEDQPDILDVEGVDAGPRAMEDYADEVTEADVGIEIMNELVRSYGAKYSAEGGWEWSVENIGEAFQEHPYWTTLDWALLVVPGAKALGANVQVARGAGVAGKAFKQGKLTRAEAILAHKELPKATGQGFLGKTALMLEGRSKWIDPKILKTGDGAWDVKFLEGLTETERIPLVRNMQQNAWRGVKGELDVVQTHADNLSRELGQLGKVDQELIYRSLATKGGAELLKGSSKKARKLGEQTREMRDWVHQTLYDKNLIPEKTYKSWIEDGEILYHPRMIQKFIDDMDPLSARAITDIPDLEKYIKFVEQVGHKAVLDPGIAVQKMAQAMTGVAHRDYVVNLAKSPLVKTKEEIAAALEAGRITAEEAAMWKSSKLSRVIPGFSAGKVAASPEVASMRKVKERFDTTREMLDEAMLAYEKTGKVHPSFGSFDEMADGLETVKRGQQRALEALGDARFGAAHGKEFKHINPQLLKGRYIDPIVTQDIDAVFAINNFTDNVVFKHLAGLSAMFKVSKTAYNPATHSRNFLANVVFHNLATGRVPGAPVDGIRELRAFLQAKKLGKAGDAGLGAMAKEAMEEGLLGHTLDRELMTDLLAIYGDAEKAKNFGLWGARRIPGMQRLANKSKRVYGYEDDVWKLDAYIKLRNKFMKTMAPDLAKKRAVHEVSKFFPMYNDTNHLTKMIRQQVPFASFTMEAIKVWNGAATYKPHLAMAWLHSAEMMTQLTAFKYDVSKEELAAARESMPGFTEGKKMTLLPWRDRGGALQFLDMSYILPLADMPAEGEKMQGAAFGLPPELNPLAGFGLTSNPLISTAIAATTGKDVFSGREVEARFLKEQTPIPIPNKMVDKFFGLTEHIANSLTTPIAPWGFAGMNLLEAAKGTKDPVTGMKMEPNIGRTIATNVLGLRMYAPSEKGAQNRIRFEQAEVNGQMGWLHREYKHSRAQGDEDGSARIVLRMLNLANENDKPASSVWDMIGRATKSGSTTGLSKKQVREASERVELASGERHRASFRREQRERDRSIRGLVQEMDE